MRSPLPQIVLLVTLLSAVPARPAQAATAQEKKAVELTQQAKEAFRGQRYMQAAMLFKQAYAQVPEPTLLFNAARAYQKGGKLREALPLFRLYLTLATYNDEETRAGRAEAVEHITAINKTLRRQEEEARKKAAAKQQTPKPAPPVTTPPATTPPTATPPTAAPPTTITPPATTPPATSPPATNPPAGTPPPAVSTKPSPPGATVLPPPAIARKKPVRRPKLFSRISEDGWTEREIAAMSFIGGGAALVLTGAILHGVAGSTLSGLDDDLAAASTPQGDVTFYPGLTQAEAQAAIDRHDRLRVSGSLVITLGAVAAGVGTYLWLSRKLDDGGKLSLAPTFAPGHVGWTLQGRF